MQKPYWASAFAETDKRVLVILSISKTVAAMLFGYNIFILGGWTGTSHFAVYLELSQTDFNLVSFLHAMILFIREHPP
jgi:hypothetical protein